MEKATKKRVKGRKKGLFSTLRYYRVRQGDMIRIIPATSRRKASTYGVVLGEIMSPRDRYIL